MMQLSAKTKEGKLLDICITPLGHDNLQLRELLKCDYTVTLPSSLLLDMFVLQHDAVISGNKQMVSRGDFIHIDGQVSGHTHLPTHVYAHI